MVLEKAADRLSQFGDAIRALCAVEEESLPPWAFRGPAPSHLVRRLTGASTQALSSDIAARCSQVGEWERGKKDRAPGDHPPVNPATPHSNPARRLRDGWWWWWCRCLYTLNRCGIRHIHRIQRINDTRRNGVPGAGNKAKAGTAHVLITSVVASELTLSQSPPFQPSRAPPPPQFLVVLNLARGAGSWELGAELGTGNWE